MASSESDDDNTPQIPLFNGQKYYYWKYRMYSFLAGYHSDELDAIEDGPFVPTHIVDGITKEKPKTQWTDDDKKKVRIGYRAKSLLLSALSYDQFYEISECVTAQEVWNKLRDVHEGTGVVKLARIDLLTVQYERFCMKPGENVKDMIMRFCDLFNHLASLGKKYNNVDLVYKVLRSLSSKWRHKVRAIENSRNLSTMPLVALFRELEEHEELMLNELAEKEAIRKKKLNSGRVAALSRKDDEEYDSDDSQELEEHEELMLNELAEKEATRKKKLNRGRVAALSRKDDEEYDSDDSQEMDLLIKDFLKFLLKEKNFKKGKKEHKKRGSSSTLSRKDDEEYDTDDSEEMNLLIKDFLKLLLKKKKFKKGKKEHKKRGPSSTLSRKDDEEYDSDDSEEMNLLIKDFLKLLLKKKKFKKGKKEHKKRGSSSTRTIF